LVPSLCVSGRATTSARAPLASASHPTPTPTHRTPRMAVRRQPGSFLAAVCLLLGGFFPSSL
jgi:hypothetical protein